jgi:hypothetical protein
VVQHLPACDWMNIVLAQCSISRSYGMQDVVSANADIGTLAILTGHMSRYVVIVDRLTRIVVYFV